MFNSRSYAEDVTSVTSGASQGPHSFNSRSYAEDVTSVTSGASQGPHSFNLVFVCLFVCVTPGAIPYLSRTVPYQQRQLATICLFVCAIDMPGAIPYLSRTIKSTVPSRE